MELGMNWHIATSTYYPGSRETVVAFGTLVGTDVSTFWMARVVSSKYVWPPRFEWVAIGYPGAKLDVLAWARFPGESAMTAIVNIQSKDETLLHS